MSLIEGLREDLEALRKTVDERKDQPKGITIDLRCSCSALLSLDYPPGKDLSSMMVALAKAWVESHLWCAKKPELKPGLEAQRRG